MANINLSQNTYVDYIASMYFKANGIQDVTFTPKVVNVDGEQVVLVHIGGVQPSTGVVVNVDMWPRNHASAKDVAALPRSLDDIKFRVGYWPSVDECGVRSLKEGTPKWVSYISGTREVTLSGERREFGESSSK